MINIEKVFMTPEFMVINDHPEPKEGTHYKKGDLISPSTIEYCEPYLKYPQIFKKLDWYEGKSLCTMLHIKAIEIVNPSYYVKGDRIKITAYMWEGLETTNPKIVGFYIGGVFRDGKHSGGHQFKVKDCFPVDENLATTKIY